MKRLILLLVLLIIVFNKCSRTNNDIPQLTLNGKAFIKVIAENSFDSLIIKTKYCSYFPLQPCLIHQIFIKEKGAYYTSYKITRPDFVEIAIQDTSFYIYVIPTDTAVIKVGIAKNLKGEPLIYHEIDDPIYRYLQKESKKFGSLYFRSPVVEKYYNSRPTSQKELEKAISLIDSSQKDRLAFLETNMNGLPKWFINTQKSDYIYLSADLQYFQNFYFQNTHLMGKYPLLNVNIYNPEALLSSNYYRFISDYFLLTFSDKKNEFSGPLRMIDLYNGASSDINSNLKGDILSYFNSCLLASIYKASDSKKEIDSVDKFVQSRDFGLSDLEKAYINQEKSDIQGSIEKQYSLKLGDKAPSFYLKDTSGNLHKLSEYQGKIVYLHFWATWCAPCIKELPSVNKLNDKIKNKPIVIINVCLDDKPDKWKQIIDKEKLQGINLICQGNIGDFLQKSYSFNSIPHYALVDDKGLIITNFCKRPFDIYDELMQHLRKN
jgi:thiol-disulfide isomerase/thioredoxin